MIISDVPEIARRIKNEKLGFVFGNEKELCDVLKSIGQMGDNEYSELIGNISQIKGDFDLDQIYARLFERLT